jgi:hypothetical protein
MSMTDVHASNAAERLTPINFGSILFPPQKRTCQANPCTLVLKVTLGGGIMLDFDVP